MTSNSPSARAHGEAFAGDANKCAAASARHEKNLQLGLYAALFTETPRRPSEVFFEDYSRKVRAWLVEEQ